MCEVIFGFIVLFFVHIVDDYYLQGWLANGKSRAWWQTNAPDEKYKYDFIVCLLEHGFSNSFLLHAAIFVMADASNWLLLLSFLFTMIFHALVDNLKANNKIINLWQDQVLHALNILILAIIYFWR